MSKYVDRVIAEVEKKYADEPEFCQTVEEVLSSLGPVVDAHPEYEDVACKHRIPRSVQRRHWTVQGRLTFCSVCKPFYYEILRL